MQAPVVDLVDRAERLRARQGAGGAVDVRDPPDGFLQIGAGVRDHVGVETHSGEDDERMLRLLTVLSSQPRPADVDRVSEVAERRLDHLGRVAQREPEIAREQIPCAAG